MKMTRNVNASINQLTSFYWGFTKEAMKHKYEGINNLKVSVYY